MKIGLFYFSGTGNTDLVATTWQKEITKNNHNITLYKVEDINSSTFDFIIFDLLIFGYPVHAFNTPKIVIDFVKGINKLNYLTNSLIYMVSGENLRLNYSSSNRLKRLLKKRNICTYSEYHYIMPYNIIFRHTEANAYKMYDMLKKIIEVDAYYYFAGNNISL